MTLLITFVLLAIAAIHALWALEIWWPIRDEEKLARTVVGAADVTRMPGPIPTWLVVAGILILVLFLWLPAGLLRQIVLGFAAAVFVLRGLIAYTKKWRRMTPEEPFATYDRRYYAPLCLALGAGLIIVGVL